MKPNPYLARLAQHHPTNAMQQRICQAYLVAYHRHDFALITIREICQIAGIVRTTFYRYFDNTVQLRNLIEDNFIAGLLASSRGITEAAIDSDDFNASIKSMIAFLQDNRQTFKLLLVERPSQSFMDKYINSINYEYYHLSHENETNLAILAGGLIGFFRFRLANNLSLDDPEVIITYAHFVRRMINAF